MFPIFSAIFVLLIISVLIIQARGERPTKTFARPLPFPNWSIEKTPPVKYRPFRYGSDYIVKMGVRRLDLDNWIELDNQWPRYHTEKLARLEKRGPHLYKKTTEASLASLEVMELLSEYLVYRYPSLFEYCQVKNKGQSIKIKATGEIYPIYSDDPLKYASLLIQDDLVIMIEGSDGQYYLKAGIVLFAGLWRLEDKFGMSLAKIHVLGSVPQYAGNLEKTVDKFFQRMNPENPVFRFAYFVQTDGELGWSSMMGPEDTYGTACEVASDSTKKMLNIEQVHLRVERQTLRRLPKSRAILFTLHPYVTPITELVKEPGVPGRLFSAIKSWTDDADEYRRSDNYKDILLKYIEEKYQEQCQNGTHVDNNDYPY